MVSRYVLNGSARVQPAVIDANAAVFRQRILPVSAVVHADTFIGPTSVVSSSTA